MKKLTLGSLFSGSGGFELAGMLAGIQPVIEALSVHKLPVRALLHNIAMIENKDVVCILDG